MPPEDERGTLRIGALSRRVGVSPALLRAWESRYGLLRPDRSEGNFRLYSAADERAVQSMKRHMSRGLSTAQAAGLALEERARGGGPLPQGEGEVGLDEALLEALLRFDEGAVHGVLDRAFALQPLERVLEEVVLQSLRRIGDDWERAVVSVGQEHFASNVLRSRLLSLARGWSTGAGRPVVLACAPREQHDIALVCFGLVLWRRGWRIVYLGQETPVADMRETAAAVDAAFLVVYAHRAELLDDVRPELAAAAGPAQLALAGPGVNRATADALGAELLDQPPVQAAEEADSRWRSLLES